MTAASQPPPADAATAGLARRNVQVVRARIGLVSTSPGLLGMDQYFSEERQEREPRLWSFLSALRRADELPPASQVDVEVTIVDGPNVRPGLTWTPDRGTISGDFTTWEQTVGDRRYTLFGNAGFLAKVSYTTLERVYGILSFHAVAMYDPRADELYVVVGSAGAGKTITMLEGCLRRGYRVFATEMTHVAVGPDGPTFYKGSLYDNVRVANIQDFPEAYEALGAPTDPQTGGDPKLCLSFARIQAEPDVLVNPTVTLLFPRIESERRTSISSEVGSRGDLVKLLYENASEMILRPRIYYERLGVGPLYYPDMETHRLRIVEQLVDRSNIRQARSILAGPRDSLAGVE